MNLPSEPRRGDIWQILTRCRPYGAQNVTCPARVPTAGSPWATRRRHSVAEGLPESTAPDHERSLLIGTSLGKPLHLQIAFTRSNGA